MPKLKVDRVISFSTEDPIHEARNILNSDPSRKWKCQKDGEKSASIVLQLEQASVISSIDIGNEHSAYVEVLVNRSSSSEDYKLLLVMSSFMSPLESRQSINVNKVRMFGYNELQSPERDQKWDRIKLVCTQPFNRHVQYGLSFVTVHSPESKADASSNAPAKLGKFLLRPDSPDNLTTGSLFARRKELTDHAPLSAAAAIREASSSTSLNSGSSKCKPQLKKTTATPSKQKLSIDSNSDTPRSRNRDELLYKKDEEETNEKIDKLIEQKNKEIKEKRAKEEAAKNSEKKQKQADKKTVTINGKQDKNKQEKNNAKLDMPSSSSHSSDNRQGANNSKRKTKEDTPHTLSKKKKSEKQTKPFNELLDGVVIVISGIQNPERATIRSNALEMGAKYKADWDSSCTHLICAFTNTPKYNQVKGKGKIVNRMWVQDCHSMRKRFPWRRYALDSKELSGNDSEEEIWEGKAKSPEVKVLFSRESGDHGDDTDTEDEIDRIEVLQKAKVKLNNSAFSADTDEENIKPQKKNSPPELPDFLENKVVYIDTNITEKTRFLLSRYIISFNGILIDEPSDIVNFAISLPQTASMLRSICVDAHIVKPDWVWECHNAKQFVPPDDFEL